MTLRLIVHNGTKWLPPVFFTIDRSASLATFQEQVAEKHSIPKEKQLITREAGRSYYSSDPMIIKGDGSRLIYDLGFTEVHEKKEGSMHVFVTNSLTQRECASTWKERMISL